MGFAPLSGGEGRLVAWSRQDGDEEQWYGLLETRGSNYLLTFPECKETRELAESLGAEFQPDPKVPSCRFRDRASLELALRRFALQSHGESARLVPVVKDVR
jgi:hypothetical protein